MEDILHMAGALFTAFFGVLAIVKPKLMAAIVGITPKGRRGISEIRAVYGGWMFGLGSYAMWSQSLDVFYCLGIGWLGAALFRTVSFVIDKSFSGQNLRMVFYELLFAILFLIKI
ncbi:DUF4345 family protein [Aquimarina sp. AU58]|uniref:DUF4345 family protein n=1 Tax=Aquimarina sp. AU58 TaxID=1874112 RepID=UPI000D649A53|nr:DUF4345 family protein [Aquimarina sp. AU58]